MTFPANPSFCQNQEAFLFLKIIVQNILFAKASHRYFAVMSIADKKMSLVSSLSPSKKNCILVSASKNLQVKFSKVFILQILLENDHPKARLG